VEIVWDFKDSKKEDGGVNDKMKNFYKLCFSSNFIGNIKRRMNDLKSIWCKWFIDENT